MRPCPRNGLEGSFDCAGTSLREVPGPLKMTTWIGWLRIENCPALEESAASKIGLYVIPCMDGLTGLP
jgi:hypothetical protein